MQGVDATGRRTPQRATLIATCRKQYWLPSDAASAAETCDVCHGPFDALHWWVQGSNRIGALPRLAAVPELSRYGIEEDSTWTPVATC